MFKFRKIISSVLAVSIIGAMGINAFASASKQNYDDSVVPEDPLGLFVEELDESLYAGLYMDDNGDINMAVTDTERVSDLMEKANLDTSVNLV